MTEPEQMIEVGGVPVPLSMAGEAVARCIAAIQITDRLIRQGFADEKDLRALRAGLTGDNAEYAAEAEGVIDAPRKEWGEHRCPEDCNGLCLRP